MKFCQECWDRAVKNGDYLCESPYVDSRVPTVAECEVHPNVSNWRLLRTLETIQYWASQPVGWKDKRAPTALSLGFGYVHRRNAEVILFDYEVYFIDHMIEIGYLEQTDTKRFIDGVNPRAVRLTAQGDAALIEYQEKKEAK